MSSMPNESPSQLMWITRKYGFGNATFIGDWTYRTIANYLLVILGAWFIFRMPVFAWNWLVIVGYAALASIVIGETPTKRNTLTNVYGIVARKPLRKVVTDYATVNTIGNGIAEVLTVEGINMPILRTHNGYYVLIYTVTSHIGNWASMEELLAQSDDMQTVFTAMRPGERLQIVIAEDVDTGLLALADNHRKNDVITSPELESLSQRRITSIDTKADGQARSYQQNVMLYVNPDNVRVVVQSLRECTRTMRPANNPVDVWLTASGFEGGVRVDEIERD